MRSAIPPVKPCGASWAETDITSPFFYIPFPVAVGANLASTGIAVTSNISGCPATWTVVDADASVDNNEGVFTCSGVGLNDYIWPGTSGADSITSGLGLLGNIFPTGTVNGVGGGILLISVKVHIPIGLTPGSLLSFGVRNGTSNDGFGLGLAASSAINFGIQNNGVLVNADISAASAVADDALHTITTLIDAQNGGILTTYDGVPVTPAGLATLLAAMDAMSAARLPVSFTIGGNNTAAVAGTRAIASTSSARMRELLVMNLTNYANAQADFYELADRLYRAPAYSLPHWMDRF